MERIQGEVLGWEKKWGGKDKKNTCGVSDNETRV